MATGLMSRRKWGAKTVEVALKKEKTMPVLPSHKSIELADKLKAAFHFAWSSQKDGYGEHSYNKRAWRELDEVIREVEEYLRSGRG